MVTITPINAVLDRMVTLGRAMDQAFTAPVGTNGSSQPAWVPQLDAHETTNAYVVQLDLPGVPVADVDVSFERNTLTVRGTRTRSAQAPEQGESRVFFRERAWGSFTRSLRFPQHVEGTRISASYQDGVLTITIPKGEAAKPRKIEIATGHPPVAG
jgi:HSP20 family protein